MSCEHAKTVPFSECGSCEDCGEEGLCDACRWGQNLGEEKSYIAPLHKCPEDIRVCEVCLIYDHEVPLIWTFAFNGAEYWCPKCGKSSGMLGAGHRIPFSAKLYHRRNNYERFTRHYLSAWGSLNCSKLYWDGKLISPRDLPKEEIERLVQVTKEGWKPGMVLL